MSCCGICGQDLGTAGIEGHICSHNFPIPLAVNRADAIHDPSDAEINSLHAQLAALGFTVRVTGPTASANSPRTVSKCPVRSATEARRMRLGCRPCGPSCRS